VPSNPLWFLPLALAAPTFVVLIAAAVLFYAYLAKVARRRAMTGLEALQHALGQVRDVQGESAAIWVNSELWLAKGGDGLRIGDRVEVVGAEGLLLRVRSVIPGANKEPDGNCRG
jgi:membrane-bound ClpP family serine protease